MLTDENAMYSTLYDIQWWIRCNHHQITSTKNKWVDRVFVKVIDLRIWDQMDKISMNQA